MNRRLGPIIVLAVAVASVGMPARATAPAPSSPSDVRVLPTLRGGAGTAQGVNERGLVVGASTTGTGRWVAVTWRRGEVRRLPGLARGGYSEARAVDDDGRIVGMAQDADGVVHAVLWRHRRIHDLGVPSPFGSFAAAVSVSGVVANGPVEDTFVGRRAYWRPDGPGAPQQLDLPPGASTSSVNDSGTVVGTHSWRNPGDPLFDHHQAFAIVDGARTDLGTLGGAGSIANDVNATNQVVGTTMTDDDPLVAFVWDDGAMGRLPDDGVDSPTPNAINDAGVVVGGDGTTGDALWWPGTTSQPVVLPRARRTHGAVAVDLAERGVVVGSATATRDGRFVLLPVLWR